MSDRPTPPYIYQVDRPTPPYILQIDEQGTEHLYLPADTAPPEPPPDPVPKVLLTFPDLNLEVELDPKDGEQLDAWTDPAGDFVMYNTLCTHPDLPAGFRAYHRPDEGYVREEWVFEYGDPWETPPAASLGPYTVEITYANGDIETVEAPVGHYWYSRWRWQSAPRPVRSHHDFLAAQGLIPRIDPTGLASGPIPTVPEYSPMAYCGIPANQGQTGGYGGLGIMTSWQAQYLTRNAPEASFRNQAEAAGSFQAHVRDTNTHTPIDIRVQYPKATMYSASQGTPYIPRGPGVNRTDQGHMPSLSYIPYLLTGDPYYLESMQFWANHNMLTMPSGSRFMMAGRYIAWPGREIYSCVLATPANVPNWLLPRSYWQGWLDQLKASIQTRMNNQSDPYYYVFHSIPDTGQSNDLEPGGSGDHVWQQNMLQLVASWIATTDDSWTDQASWLIQNGIARASATSGWPRSRANPYHIRLQNAGTLREALAVGTNVIRLQYPQPGFKPGVSVRIDSESMVLSSATPDQLDWTVSRPKPVAHSTKSWVYGPKTLSWKEAGELNVFTYGWEAEDNSQLSPKTTDLTYHSYMRAALAQAITAGLQVPDLQLAYSWIDGEIRRLVTLKKLKVDENWCVAPIVSRRARQQASDVDDPRHSEELWMILEDMRGEDEIAEGRETLEEDPAQGGAR